MSEIYEPNVARKKRSSASLLQRVRRGKGARERRLIFFPPAGSSASSARSLSNALPEEWSLWSVQYPGRGPRLREPVAISIRDIADDCLDIVAKVANKSVLYGHSFGAFVAYDVAQLLDKRGCASAGLLVSGVSAPGVEQSTVSPEELSDEELIASLGEQGGTTLDLLANEELMRLILPALRSDLQLAREYTDDHRRRLSTAILGIGGRADRLVTLEHVLTWRNVTNKWLGHDLGEGGHFYYLEDPSPLTRALEREWFPESGDAEQEITPATQA